MIRRLYISIRLRFDKMLSGAETAQLLDRFKSTWMFHAAQMDAPVEHQIVSSVSYTVAADREDGVSKMPNSDRLLAAAKKDDPDTDVLAEVFFLNRSVF